MQVQDFRKKLGIPVGEAPAGAIVEPIETTATGIFGMYIVCKTYPDCIDEEVFHREGHTLLVNIRSGRTRYLQSSVPVKILKCKATVST